MMETVEAELCFPHLLNTSCRKPQTDPEETLLHYALLCLICVPTAMLNLLVVVSIAHFRHLHTSSNLIILSLAMSDFLVGLVLIPTEGIRMNACWTFGDLFCVLYVILPSTLFMASTGNIVLISVDRYVAICDPLHYTTRMTKKVASINVSVCWLYALIYAILILSENFINLGKYKSCEGECVVYYSKEVDLIFPFVIPVSIIILLYTRVFVVAVSQARAMRSQITVMTSKTSKKSEIKAARNLGVVVVVYLMCYCPFYCVAYWSNSIFILDTPIEIILVSLFYMNSCINPLIYALLYPWFRKAIKVIVTLQILRPGSCDLKIL